MYLLFVLYSLTGSRPIHPTQLGNVCRLLQPKSYEWHMIGGYLGVDYGFREGLLRDGIFRTNDEKLAAVLNEWMNSKTQCCVASWHYLIRVLFQLEFCVMAEDVIEFFQSE